MESIDIHRLGIASREIAVATAVPASSSGIPAAIRAPNTISSSASVIGSDVTSALRKSAPTISPTALLMLAEPASAISRSRCPAWTAATALSAVVTVWVAAVVFARSPTRVKVTRADRPSAEIRP